MSFTGWPGTSRKSRSTGTQGNLWPLDAQNRFHQLLISYTLEWLSRERRDCQGHRDLLEYSKPWLVKQLHQHLCSHSLKCNDDSDWLLSIKLPLQLDCGVELHTFLFLVVGLASSKLFTKHNIMAEGHLFIGLFTRKMFTGFMQVFIFLQAPNHSTATSEPILHIDAVPTVSGTTCVSASLPANRK